MHAGAEMSGQTRNPARRQVSQNSAVHLHEVDIVLGELVSGRKCSAEPDRSQARHFHQTVEQPPEYKRSGFPRKEVIQPQLPLRLPCYDFTPVTDPTFDGFLPYGLEHRLRVLPASVV